MEEVRGSNPLSPTKDFYRRFASVDRKCPLGHFWVRILYRPPSSVVIFDSYKGWKPWRSRTFKIYLRYSGSLGNIPIHICYYAGSPWPSLDTQVLTVYNSRLKRETMDIKNSSALDAFQLFYEELISSNPQLNRIRRIRATANSK